MSTESRSEDPGRRQSHGVDAGDAGEVQRRAKEGARFGLLIPPVHPDDPIDWSAADARRLLERAGAGTVEEVDVGRGLGAAGARARPRRSSYDAVIVSTVGHHLERWRHHDLPHRLKDLEVP